MGRAIVTGFIATTGYIPAYGRALLNENNVRSIYERVKTGLMPSFGNHDERNPLDTTLRRVELRRTDDGGLGVWAEIEFADERDAANYRGFSIGWFENNYVPSDEDPREIVKFGADAFNFTDDERDVAAHVLDQTFAVSGGRYYQLAAEPPATVVLLFMAETLRQIPAHLLAKVLFEALRHLVRTRSTPKPTLFKFNVETDAGEVRGLLETNDAEALREVTQMVHSLARHKAGTYQAETKRRVWRAIPLRAQSQRKKGR